MKTDMSISKQYTEAMRRGDHSRCIQIEEQNGLYGWPPEIVMVGLGAIDCGEDPSDAIDRYMGVDES